MRADLSLQQSPPFSVPARFLLSAPLFGLLAALVLLWYGPDAIKHRWTPEVLAVTHFLTLGFIAMSMLGALMQLIPVLMGVIIPRPVVFSSLIHTPLFIGTLTLGMAWLLQINLLFIIAAALLGFTFVVFITVAAERLLRSGSRHATRGMMLMSLLALFITISIGIYLALGYGGQTKVFNHSITELHLSWGLLGWVLILVIAVAYQVIPMFQITREYPVIHQRWMGWVLLAAIFGLSMDTVSGLLTIRPLAAMIEPEIITGISSAILVACLLIFAITTLWTLHNRLRQLPDTTMKFWQLAMSNLILVAALWSFSAIFAVELPVFLLPVLMINGFAMTAINGMMYKILPFIIWLHLSVQNKNLRTMDKRDSQIKVPHMRKIIPEPAGLWQFRLHLLSLILLVLATIFPVWFYYPAVLLFAGAQCFLLINLLKAVYFYNIKATELSNVIALTINNG